MKFLASELNNSRELFYLLLEVKNADAMAKNVDVYNKYKLVKSKYLEFINSFFSYNNSAKKNMDSNTEEDSTGFNGEKVTTAELDRIVENIVSKKNIISIYQPIIDIVKKKVMGYEVLTKIKSSKNINMLDVFNHAKDIELYDKVQQTLLVDRMESFLEISNKESDCIFIISDLTSYSKYINKPMLNIHKVNI